MLASATYMCIGTDIASAARRACILEASAEKPGNVTPTHAFHDMRYEDFVRSAEAIAPVFGHAGELPVGELVFEAIAATQRAVGRNTNLGIVLLLAPLAKAAARPGGPLNERVGPILADLTTQDARQVYAAIRLAAPGGLGQVGEHDVRMQPTSDLRTAMAAAARRDSIASEYVTDYAITFGLIVPALAAGYSRGEPTAEVVTNAYLQLLAEVPDTLIARKHGRVAAEWVAAQARRVLALGGPATSRGAAALGELDRFLRDDRNSWNPGTSADLVAAGLFVIMLENG